MCRSSSPRMKHTIKLCMLPPPATPTNTVYFCGKHYNPMQGLMVTIENSDLPSSINNQLNQIRQIKHINIKGADFVLQPGVAFRWYQEILALQIVPQFHLPLSQPPFLCLPCIHVHSSQCSSCRTSACSHLASTTRCKWAKMEQLCKTTLFEIKHLKQLNIYQQTNDFCAISVTVSELKVQFHYFKIRKKHVNVCQLKCSVVGSETYNTKLVGEPLEPFKLHFM